MHFSLLLKPCSIVLLLSHFLLINKSSTHCFMIHWCCNLSVELVNIYSTITSFPPFFAFLKNFDLIWHIRFVGYQQILTFQEQCLENGNNSDKVCLNKEIKRKKIMTEEQSKITKSITESMSSEWQSSYFCRHLRLTLTRTVSCDHHLLRNRR